MGVVVVAVAAPVLVCAAYYGNRAAEDYDGPNDKFRHCWASCAIARTCGAGISAIIQLLKEGHDLALTNGTWRDSLYDMIANQQCVPPESHLGAAGGWLAWLFRESCESCCKRKVGHWLSPAPY